MVDPADQVQADPVPAVEGGEKDEIDDGQASYVLVGLVAADSLRLDGNGGGS